MSGRSDLRMYVERLFEGRTLDAETIELKEEIYGNLVARFDDYVEQGMSEDEAYRRTCEAVTSIDDVMDERDGQAERAAAGETAIMPDAGASPEQDETPVEDVAATVGKAHGRWTTGRVVIAAAVAVVALGIAGATIVGLVSAKESAQTQQAESTIVATDPDTTPTATDGAPTTTTNGNGNGGGQGTTAQDGTDNGNGASSSDSTGLRAQVLAHSLDDLAVYADTSIEDTGGIARLVASLPLGDYANKIIVNISSNTVEVTYTYQDRDLLARDDDHVDMALVYDAAAIMCAVPELDALSVTEVEPDDDDGGNDYDLRVFERSALEGLLGGALDRSRLSSDAWEELRTRLMTESVYDRAWDLADRD